MSWSDRRLSKFLSLVLRHRPEKIGLRLGPEGWAHLETLAAKSREAVDAPVDVERIRELVDTQSKPRFTISRDGRRIRANYGHSVEVDLGLEPGVPPDSLYHGTAEASVERILREGLKSRSRRYVHLSTAPTDAREVGTRHGRPRILRVPAGRMHGEGHRFYRPAEGIWLTDFVPPDVLEVVEG